MEGGAFNTFASDDRIPSACVCIHIYILGVLDFVVDRGEDSIEEIRNSYGNKRLLVVSAC